MPTLARQLQLLPLVGGGTDHPGRDSLEPHVERGAAKLLEEYQLVTVEGRSTGCDTVCLLSLARLSTVGQTLVGVISSTVIAGGGAAILDGNVAWPKPAYVVAIDPSSAFAKPLQVHHHRVATHRSLEGRLVPFEQSVRGEIVRFPSMLVARVVQL